MSSNDTFGPGYKPPEKSHVFDWRSCLSNTRDNSRSDLNRNKNERKPDYEKFRIPPPPTPREKWKLLDRASKNSAKVHRKPQKEHATTVNQSDTQSTLKVSCVDTSKKEAVTNPSISSNSLNDNCNSTTVKIINFVAIKTRKNIANPKNTDCEKPNPSYQVKIEDGNATNAYKCLELKVDIDDNNLNNDVIYEEDYESEVKRGTLEDVNHIDNSISEIVRSDGNTKAKGLANQSNGSEGEQPENDDDVTNPVVDIPTLRKISTNNKKSNDIDGECTHHFVPSFCKEKESIPNIDVNKEAHEAIQQHDDSKEFLKNDVEVGEGKSGLIFSEPQSNFITDQFLLESRFGNMYTERENSSESVFSAEVICGPSSSVNQPWRTRIECIQPREISNSNSCKINQSLNSSQISENHKKNYSELLQQSLIDVKKSRARDTISNVLYKKTGFRYY